MGCTKSKEKKPKGGGDKKPEAPKSTDKKPDSGTKGNDKKPDSSKPADTKAATGRAWTKSASCRDLVFAFLRLARVLVPQFHFLQSYS